MANFPTYEGPNLTNIQVINELEKVQNLGWDVRDDGSIAKNDKIGLPGIYRYIITVDENKVIHILSLPTSWEITAIISGNNQCCKRVTTLESFINAIEETSKTLGINVKIEKPKSSIRTKQFEPATNKIKLIDLIKGRFIKDIFDPYFDNKSIEFLLSLSHIGVKFNNILRCLTSSKKINQIDKDFLLNFNNEIKISTQIKLLVSNIEHRRFLILNDNKIIIFGCSINDINKNEAIHEENDKTNCLDDISFFEQEWRNGENF